jgi:antibiotic biosynthesis monooxygenase (ABM) superfamily enzyme
MKTDAEILDWLEQNHTLHHQVEILYVVDGYEVTITRDGDPIPSLQWKGESLREACSYAMVALGA